MTRTRELEYDLPGELIATAPAEPRDSARLMVVDPEDPTRRRHRRFAELDRELRPGDLLVVNTTAVLPASLTGIRASTGGRVGGLYLETTEQACWRVMLRSNGRLREGDRIDLLRPDGEWAGVWLDLRAREGETWWVDVGAVSPLDAADTQGLLREVGRTPLPPYISSARRARGEGVDDDADRAWYQTVYAEAERAGSVAAPTAGLHFTDRLLERLLRMGVERERLILHVGAGTFRPVEAERLEDHEMHAEWFEVPAETLRAVARARGERRRVIAVGTTSVRALESVPDNALRTDADAPVRGSTELLISPGYRFRAVDGLITNFHLPRSTLLALVGAMVAGGIPSLLDVYAQAVRERYRFYSYGDAMLLLPGRGRDF